MKTQLALPGETTPAIEVERMVKIREAIGPDIKLMCDINQRWRPEQAMDIGSRVEDAGVGLFWLEDVTTADDYPGLARISDALSTPVAGGEYVWGIVPFRHMMEARSVDVPMVDLVRVGGITQWLKVAGMAEAFNLPVVSHLIPEVHVHLIGAAPNGLTVEYMPWLGHMFKEVPVQQGGELAMPTKPGLGLEFDDATLERYKVSLRSRAVIAGSAADAAISKGNLVAFAAAAQLAGDEATSAFYPLYARPRSAAGSQPPAGPTGDTP